MELTSSNSMGTLTFEYGRTYNTSTNVSTVTWTLYFTTAKDVAQLKLTGNITINGTSYGSKTTTITAPAGSIKQLDTGTLTVTHADQYADAALTVTTNLTASNGSTVPNFSSKTAYLSSGHPFARFSSYPSSIHDEVTELKVTINVPQPANTTRLAVGFDFGAGMSYTSLTPSSTSVSFTYALTQSDYIAIQSHTTSKQFTGQIAISSRVNGTTYNVKKDLIIRFINAEPTFDVSIVDVNTVTANLTGDAANKLVKGHSNAQVTITSYPKKGATIASESVETYEELKWGSSNVFYNIGSSEFEIGVTDSRGFYDTRTVTRTLVNYVTLTCNLEVDVPTYEGATTVRIKGNCFYGSFGIKTNTLTVRYRYAESGYAYSNWYTTAVTIADNNTYSLNIPITGLDYTKSYTFEAQAEDLLETTTSIEVKVKTIPVFDWGEDDFNFNVPVNFSKGFTQPNSALKQLWNGQWHMNGTSTTINLIEPVSAQANGIVLVFTPYNSSTGLANDEKLMSFFVSKKVVQVMPSKLHTFFLLADASFSTVGAKSLYIGDDRITGHSASGSSGSASSTTGSIQFNNAGFVLRWVLGV